jgi:Xaa-Pro aminopeptidase
MIRNELGEELASKFIHGTGPGWGLQIHEEPYLNQYSDYKLQKGQAFSVEPGVYIENWGGIRIEDIVFLDDNDKVINLTKTSKKLTEIALWGVGVKLFYLQPLRNTASSLF